MKRLRSEALWLVGLMWLALLDARPACAKELDQFTDRLRVLAYYAGGYRQYENAPSPARVDAILDGEMNTLLDELAARLQRQPAAQGDALVAHAQSVFQHPLLAELVTPYEEWAKHEPRLPLYRVRDKGIYGYAVSYDDMRITWYIELSPIIQVAGVLIGLDKLGHFLAQGFQYWTYYRQLPRDLTVPERAARVRQYGHEQEVRQLGIATGGVYSPADLAANWAGMLFFLALFEDVQVEAEQHAHYFARDAAGVYRRVRDFHWSEWITADWDEVQNPAYAQQQALFDKVVENFWRPSGAPGSVAPSICAQYQQDPAAFIGPVQKHTRSIFMLPERVREVAPFPIDAKRICHAFGPGDAQGHFR